MKTIVKRIAFSILPDRVLQAVKKVYYAYALGKFSGFDEVDFKIIRHLVTKGGYVIDIGANIGAYTKFLSELVGSNGCVFSIEPIPLTYEILSSNMKKLKLGNVVLINCAISDTDGYVTMEIPLYEESAGENFYQARIVDENINGLFRQVKVESRTMDSLFSGPNNISFIKCDVEGHELKCIKGAMGMIRNIKPAWLIEFSEDPDDDKSTAYETFRVLNEEGYKAFWFDGQNLNMRKVGDKSTNYFFLVQKHLQTLQGKFV
jgi:FkbM family methyltransferase